MPYGITVLPACHPTEVRIPPLPTAEAGTRFRDPGWMQGWVDLCYVKADRLGIEHATCKSQVHRPNSEPPRSMTLAKLEKFCVIWHMSTVFRSSWTSCLWLACIMGQVLFCTLSSVVCNAAGGRAGRPPGAWTVGAPTTGRVGGPAADTARRASTVTSS